jgi:predicted metallo-beta-lactamase superfamily hydrolase
MGSIFQEAFKKGHKIVTAAELVGKENLFLEAQRQQLYKDQPPNAEFCRWMKSLSKKVITKPPI